MEFLNSYLSRQFAGKPLVASRNVICFQRLGYLFISEVKKGQVKITHQNTGVMFLRHVVARVTVPQNYAHAQRHARWQSHNIRTNIKYKREECFWLLCFPRSGNKMNPDIFLWRAKIIASLQGHVAQPYLLKFMATTPRRQTSFKVSCCTNRNCIRQRKRVYQGLTHSTWPLVISLFLPIAFF